MYWSTDASNWFAKDSHFGLPKDWCFPHGPQGWLRPHLLEFKLLHGGLLAPTMGGSWRWENHRTLQIDLWVHEPSRLPFGALLCRTYWWNGYEPPTRSVRHASFITTTPVSHVSLQPNLQQRYDYCWELKAMCSTVLRQCVFFRYRKRACSVGVGWNVIRHESIWLSVFGISTDRSDSLEDTQLVVNAVGLSSVTMVLIN